MKKKILNTILVLYSLMLVKFIVFKYPSDVIFSFSNANWIPFKTILGYSSGEPTLRVAIYNLLGNIVVLIPFGFLLSSIYQKLNLKNFLLIGVITGLVLEISQAIFKSGIFDIDDILLNFLGVIIGYLVFIFFSYIFKKVKIYSAR